MFGRHATLPVNINFTSQSAINQPSAIEKLHKYSELEDPDPSIVLHDQQQILEEAKTNGLEAQRKQKEQYDKSM